MAAGGGAAGRRWAGRIVDAVLESLELESGVSAMLAASLHAEAGDIDVVQAILATLGESGARTPLAAALVSEAGRVELTQAIFEELGLTIHSTALKSAVADEAGEVSLAEPVLERLGHSDAARTSDLGMAIRAAAGDIGDVWSRIAAEIEPSAGTLPVREAVVQEAGEIDIVRPVMHTVQRDSLGIVGELPAPANQPRWGFAALLAVAAAALLMIGVRASVGELPLDIAPTPLQFAAAGEVVVHELEYSENVQVFQVEGDEGAMILWVDEEAML